MIRMILFLLTLLYALPSLGAHLIGVIVKDEAYVPLSYCDVILLNKFYLITGTDGSVHLDASLCEVGDTMRLNYLGYERLDIVISQRFLETPSHTFNLTPKTYHLEDVEVQTAFNAEKFFSKKKKNMLLPYSENHSFTAFAKVSYINTDGKSKSLDL